VSTTNDQGPRNLGVDLYVFQLSFPKPCVSALSQLRQRKILYIHISLHEKMSFANVVRSAINGTLTPEPGDVNNYAFRSPSSLLLKTFALRMAVITSYGHLGSLQNLTAKSSTSIPRMLILLILPGVTLFEFSKNYFGLVVILLLRIGLLLFRIRIRGFYSLKQFLMVGVGLHIPHHKVSTNGGCTNQAVYIGEVLPTRSKHVATPWTWGSFLLKSSRAVVLLVVLAQAIASLVLILRRRHVEHATLLLDSTNGLYAIIGIVSCCNSLMIVAVGGEWQVLGDAPGRVLPQSPPILRLVPIDFISGSLVTVFMRGQFLLEYSEHLRTGFGKLTTPPSYLSAPSLPIVIIYVSMQILAVFSVTKNLIDSLYETSTNEHWNFKKFSALVIKLCWRCCLSMAVSAQIVYWMSLFYELAVIMRKSEMQVWGVDKWRWYDPLSDVLFVYWAFSGSLPARDASIFGNQITKDVRNSAIRSRKWQRRLSRDRRSYFHHSDKLGPLSLM